MIWEWERNVLDTSFDGRVGGGVLERKMDWDNGARMPALLKQF